MPDETTAPFVDETPPAPMLPPLEPQHSRTNGYIKTVALEKRFGASKVVDDFSLHVDKGEIYGLLGPNGVRVEVPVNNADAQGVTPGTPFKLRFPRATGGGLTGWCSCRTILCYEGSYMVDNLSLFRLKQNSLTSTAGLRCQNELYEKGEDDSPRTSFLQNTN